MIGLWRAQRHGGATTGKRNGLGQGIATQMPMEQSSHHGVAGTRDIDHGGRERSLPAAGPANGTPVNTALAQTKHDMAHTLLVQPERGQHQTGIVRYRQAGQRLRLQPIRLERMHLAQPRQQTPAFESRYRFGKNGVGVGVAEDPAQCRLGQIAVDQHGPGMAHTRRTMGQPLRRDLFQYCLLYTSPSPRD